MVYLKEFAKSVGILVAANVFYILLTFLSLGLIFSPTDSFTSHFLGYALLITAPAVLLIFAFRAWRLYKKQGAAIMATSIATLLVYTAMVFLLGFSNVWVGMFNIYGSYTFPFARSYENSGFASQVKISPSKVCIVRGSTTEIADVGTSILSMFQTYSRWGIKWGLVWNGSITASKGPIRMWADVTPFDKVNPSSGAVWHVDATSDISVEIPDGSGTYVSFGTAANLPASVSDGKPHKLRVSFLLSPIRNFAQGYNVTITTNLLHSASEASYTTMVPDTVLAALIANASSTVSTPYTFCDSL